MSYREGEKVRCKLEKGEPTGVIVSLTPNYVEVKLENQEVIKLRPQDISALRPGRRPRSSSRGAQTRKRSSSKNRKTSRERPAPSSPSPVKRPPRKNSASPSRNQPVRRSSRLSSATVTSSPEKLNHEQEEEEVKLVSGLDSKEPPASRAAALVRGKWLEVGRQVMLSLLATAALPALSLAAHLACTKRHCSLSRWPSVPVRPSSYLHPESLALYTGWLLLQAVLCLAPVGRVVVSPEYVKYRLNGLHQLVVSLAVIGGGLYLNQPMVALPAQRPLAWASASHLVCLVLALVLWLLPSRSSRSKPWAGSYLMGKEVNPRLLGGRLDVKQLLMRLCLNTLVSMDLILCVVDYRAKGIINHGVVMVTLMQLALAVVLYIQEESMLNTALVSRDGCGYLMVAMAGAVLPSLYHGPASTWHSQGSYVPLALEVGCPLLCAVGLGLLVVATRAKKGVALRSKGESLASKSRRPLVLYGGWGLVRHPNYTLLLLILLSWNLASGWLHSSTWLPMIVGIVILSWRSIVMERGNDVRYGNVWSKYTDRVPSRMIPKIY